jgi:hypothetical protein
LAQELAASVADARRHTAQLPCRPKVYFEEWDDPDFWFGWVSELVEVAQRSADRRRRRHPSDVNRSGSSGRSGVAPRRNVSIPSIKRRPRRALRPFLAAFTILTHSFG